MTSTGGVTAAVRGTHRIRCHLHVHILTHTVHVGVGVVVCRIFLGGVEFHTLGNWIRHDGCDAMDGCSFYKNGSALLGGDLDANAHGTD